MDYSKILSSKTLTIGAIIAASMIIYFVVVFSFLPDFYQSLELPKPLPRISEVVISESSIVLGENFDIKLQATNSGDAADFQLVTVAFPNLTSIENTVQITTYDFLQSPFIIDPGEDVGSEYSGPARTVTASYPSIEAYSRPWKTNESYNLGLEVIPSNPGRFTVFVKSVSFPHTHELSHYPLDGFLDYQNEFVSVYSIEVYPKP